MNVFNETLVKMARDRSSEERRVQRRNAAAQRALAWFKEKGGDPWKIRGTNSIYLCQFCGAQFPRHVNECLYVAWEVLNAPS